MVKCECYPSDLKIIVSAESAHLLREWVRTITLRTRAARTIVKHEKMVITGVPKCGY
jgi:hypothetical protein